MERRKRAVACIIALILIFSILVTGSGFGSIAYAESGIASNSDAQDVDGLTDIVTSNTGNYKGDNYEVNFVIDSKWDNGFNATITIRNTGVTPIENWCMSFPLEQEIANIWNASIEETYEDFYVIKNVGWNQDIPVNGSISFGITSYETFTGYPEYYTLIGNEVELKNGDYSVKYEITEDWGDGYKALITITNNKPMTLEDWRLSFEYGDNVITKIWDAVILLDNDGKYLISCESYNQNIPSGQSVTFGIMVEPGISETEINNIVLSEYETNVSGKYVTLIGYLPENSTDLELYMESSEECSKYEIYASFDGEPETLIYTVENSNEYIYTIPSKFSKIDIYTRGYYGEYAYLDSLVLSVELRDGKYIVIMPDTDGDGLEDCIELYYGSDIEITDTDGDGLDDYYEVAISSTSPVNVDTDSNGILDGDEDYDRDGLSILNEKSACTNPWDSDTDWDNLTDGDEVNLYGTNPLLPDTDDDGLDDEDEILLGTDPLNPDTDGDGILDGDERFEQNFTYVVENEECVIREVTISMEGTGCLQNNTYVESLMDKDILCTDVVGLVGEPFEIETESEFDTATITFKLDTDKLGEIPFDNLLYLWYDEINHKFVELDTILDEENGTVSVVTTHFSKYMLVNSADWYEAWAEEIDYNPEFAGKDIHYNTVLAIDCSGSMNNNDPITMNTNVNSQYDAMYRKRCHRITGGMTFINRMSGEDKTAVVLFSGSANVATAMTDDRQSLRLALQKITSSGGTSFNAALRTSMNAFDTEMLEDENACNRIILLSDGQSTYSTSLLEEISDKGIRIHTIGLGSGANIKTLQEIADYTNGESYKADTSDELEDLYERIYSTDDFDKRDDDHDGLYDIIEEAGIRLCNGRVIHTDSSDDDSDDDGLLDGEEINPVPVYWEKQVAINGKMVVVHGYFFIMYSDPNSIDSDGDGLYDNSKRVVKDSNDNDKTVAPKDTQPLNANGPKGIWDKQYELEKSGEGIAHYLCGDYEGKITAEIGQYFLNFYLDDKEIALHSQVITWQEIFGYNNLYDCIFYLGTNGNMRKEKFAFKYNDTDYVIWTWRGDYLNIGSGAEIGFYRENLVYGTWRAINFEVPMSLNLYNMDNGNLKNLFCWAPYERQWWITGFCPNEESPIAENLVSLGSIDLSDHKGMYNALKTEVNDNNHLKNYMIFDDIEYTVWLIWWDK